MRSFAFTLLLAAVCAQAQPGCPAVNFQTAVSATLPSSDTTQTILLRQSDGSYTAYEMATQSPYRIIRTIPNYQKQLTACVPGHSSLTRLPAPTGTGNLPGTPSQPQAFARLKSGNYLAVNLSGAGTALFDPELNLISETEGPPGSFFVLMDVNGDGNPDLVTASADENVQSFQATTTVEVFLGDGGMGLRQTASLQVAGNYVPVSLAVADLNGDHKPDIVLASSVYGPDRNLGGKISTFLGNGDGSFQAERVVLSSSEGGIADGIEAVAIADLNGDGKADLTFTRNQLGNAIFLAVSLGHGDGTFAQPVQYPISYGLDANLYLAIGDVNGDGFPDIVTSGISIFFGDGTGAFPRRQDYLVPAYGCIILTDIDGDGRLDIVTGSGNPLMLSGDPGFGSLTVLFGWDGGTFFGPEVSIAPAGTSVAGDFNGDGIPDLVDASLSGISVMAGDGKGGFSSTFTYDFGSNSVGAITVADFNHDGRPDIAVGIYGDPASPGLIEIFLGRGDGTFQTPLSFSVPTWPTALTTGDFNADGKQDLAVVVLQPEQVGQELGTPQPGTLLVFLGHGDGTFAAPVSYPAAAGADAVVTGDFNGDGKLDLAVGEGATETFGGGVNILLGNGDGTYSAGASIALSAGSGSLAAADFNRDGKLDLVVLTNTGPAILLGHGDGTFGPPSTYPASGHGLAVGDLNGDKIPDLIVGPSYLLGNGDGTFQAAVPLVVGPPQFAYYYLNSPIAADVNRDGKIDIVGASPLGVASFLNISQPQVAVTVVSAASFAIGPVAPDSLAAAFGKNLASSTAVAPAEEPFPTTLGDTTIRVQDAAGTTRPAELLYVSSGQVNFVVPEGTSSGTATVTITSQQPFSNAILAQTAQVQVAPVEPAMFMLNATGLAAAYVMLTAPGQPPVYEPVFTLENSGLVAAPFSLGTASQQASLTLYGTGLRDAAAGGVTVEVQGVNVPVTSAGPVSGIDGLDQVTVTLPRTLAGSGDVSIVVTAAGMTANTVQVTIQ